MDNDAVLGLLAALDFAAEKHRDQRRKGVDASPYINHPIRVAMLLAECGVREVPILQAAVLHDTLEDTRTTGAEIEAAFGPVVRAWVEEVTDDKRLPKADRKRMQIEHAPSRSHGARMIKIADKIANVTDIAAAPPAGWTLERRVEYLVWAEAVVSACRGTHTDLEQRWDRALAEARARLFGDPTA
jgi:guanosine-3',5'-bis(diphosphate) 3'-pyrophosphohydrolase